jgi:hypothetical protein
MKLYSTAIDYRVCYMATCSYPSNGFIRNLSIWILGNCSK